MEPPTDREEGHRRDREGTKHDTGARLPSDGADQPHDREPRDSPADARPPECRERQGLGAAVLHDRGGGEARRVDEEPILQQRVGGEDHVDAKGGRGRDEPPSDDHADRCCGGHRGREGHRERNREDAVLARDGGAAERAGERQRGRASPPHTPHGEPNCCHNRRGCRNVVPDVVRLPHVDEGHGQETGGRDARRASGGVPGEATHQIECQHAADEDDQAPDHEERERVADEGGQQVETVGVGAECFADRVPAGIEDAQDVDERRTVEEERRLPVAPHDLQDRAARDDVLLGMLVRPVQRIDAQQSPEEQNRE